MNKMSLQKSIQNFGIKQALKYMEKDPEENIPKLMDMVDKFAPDGWYEAQRNMIRKVIKERGNWYQLILRIYQLDPEVRKAFFQNFIFNAPGGVGSQLDILIRAVGTYRLDEPDGTDGDEIVLLVRLGVVFFGDVRDKAQIVLNEHVARLNVARKHALDVFLFLLCRERARERAARQVEREQHGVRKQIKCNRQHKNASSFSPSYGRTGSPYAVLLSMT